MYIEKKREIRRPITQRDITEIRQKTKIGDTVDVMILNPRFANGELIKRKGVVTMKSRDFAVVRLSCGVRYCTAWAELIQSERKSAEEERAGDNV